MSELLPILVPVDLLFLISNDKRSAGQLFNLCDNLFYNTWQDTITGYYFTVVCNLECNGIKRTQRYDMIWTNKLFCFKVKLYLWEYIIIRYIKLFFFNVPKFDGYSPYYQLLSILSYTEISILSNIENVNITVRMQKVTEKFNKTRHYICFVFLFGEFIQIQCRHIMGITNLEGKPRSLRKPIESSLSKKS